MRGTFQQAAMPDRFRVAGLPMHTHCLGHALLLQRLGNPYGMRPVEETDADPRGPGLGDQALAAWVCFRNPGQALRALQRDRSPATLSWFAWKISRHGRERVHAELRAYLQAAWPEIPCWTQTEVRTRTLGADLMHRLVLTQRRLGLSLEAAMHVPLAVALWDNAAVAEEGGAVSLASDRDRALMAYYDALTASGSLPLPGSTVTRN